MSKPIAAVFVAALTLSGCASMTDTEQRTLTGAAIGAAGGALIGSFSANAGAGMLIGAAAGTVGGYLYDQYEQSKQDAYRQGYRAGQSQTR